MKRTPLERRTALQGRRGSSGKVRAKAAVASPSREVSHEVARVVDAGPRRAGPVITKAVELVEPGILARHRDRACGFCGTVAVARTAHHFPPKSNTGVQVDLLSVGACGDGTTGCHGKAQRYEIPREVQALAVGKAIGEFVAEALAAVPRHDDRRLILDAILSELRSAEA